MNKLILILLLLISSCSSSLESKRYKFQILKELWEKRSTKSEVIKSLGAEFTEVESGIVYKYPNSDRPEIGLFFDSSNRLVEQFLFLDDGYLEHFKSSVNCNWKEVEEVKSVAHYQRTIKKGSCPGLSITYETYLGLNAYEVRWKR
jgi:hypothetical protein